jgi:hypothetical protein
MIDLIGVFLLLLGVLAFYSSLFLLRNRVNPFLSSIGLALAMEITFLFIFKKTK